MTTNDQILSQLTDLGITNCDAVVIADCIITKRSCSWVNTDPVDDKMLRDLHDLVVKNSYAIRIKVDAIPTRGKFVWEVKALQ